MYRRSSVAGGIKVTSHNFCERGLTYLSSCTYADDGKSWNSTTVLYHEESTIRWHFSGGFFSRFPGSETPMEFNSDPPKFHPGGSFFPHGRVISTIRGICLSRGSAAAAKPSKTANTNVRFQQVLYNACSVAVLSVRMCMLCSSALTALFGVHFLYARTMRGSVGCTLHAG